MGVFNWRGTSCLPEALQGAPSSRSLPECGECAVRRTYPAIRYHLWNSTGTSYHVCERPHRSPSKAIVHGIGMDGTGIVHGGLEWRRPTLYPCSVVLGCEKFGCILGSPARPFKVAQRLMGRTSTRPTRAAAIQGLLFRALAWLNIYIMPGTLVWSLTLFLHHPTTLSIRY